MLIYFVVVIAASSLIGMVTGGGVQVPAGGQGAPSFNPLMMLINQVLNTVVSAFFMGGIYRMAVNQVRGQAVSVGDMFSATDVFPAVLIASILTNIAIMIGLLLCIIPGLFVAGALMFTLPLIVDRRLSAIDAMSTSFNTLKGQAFSAFTFALVVGLVILAGALACGLGVLVTMPIGLVAVALLYRDFFPGNEATQPANTSCSAPPPIPPAF
jgi:uncharacterized membrane protein